MHKTKEFLYCLFDHVSGKTMYYQVAPNDSRAILELLHCTRVPLKDSCILRLGELSTSLPDISPSSTPFYNPNSSLSFDFYSSPVIVDWSACKLPENKADALAPLGLSPDEVAQITREHISDSVNSVR